MYQVMLSIQPAFLHLWALSCSSSARIATIPPQRRNSSTPARLPNLRHIAVAANRPYPQVILPDIVHKCQGCWETRGVSKLPSEQPHPYLSTPTKPYWKCTLNLTRERQPPIQSKRANRASRCTHSRSQTTRTLITPIKRERERGTTKHAGTVSERNAQQKEPPTPLQDT